LSNSVTVGVAALHFSGVGVGDPTRVVGSESSKGATLGRGRLFVRSAGVPSVLTAPLHAPPIDAVF